MLIPVLLTGGAGTRLWPLSRQSHPKQFLDLTGEGTLLEATARRFLALPEVGGLVAVAGESLRFVVAEQLRRGGADSSTIVLEPEGRNTAPAIALAALQVAKTFGRDAILCVAPSDHLIADQVAFETAVAQACAAAADGSMVTFGVVPDRPETGFGYLRAGAGKARRELLEFVEKPDRETAETYLASGDYYWNSGMFVFQAGACLDALQAHAPDILEVCEAAMADCSDDGDFVRINAGAFLECRSESIDYAVMEKLAGGVVVPLAAGWNDVGSWQFLSQTRPADDNGNRLLGDVVTHDTHNSTVYARDRLVATLGIADSVVVETKDAVLVAAADRLQDIRALVSQLDAAGRSETVEHPRVYRPWGSYETVDEGERFKVKRIIVTPGAKLSMQMHHHRAEHWTVVTGTAQVTRGDETFMLTEDQSTYIPIGTRHRLENPGAIPLELIEVQTGSYLGEDDIVRFDDDYGR